MPKAKLIETQRRATVIMEEEDYQRIKQAARERGLSFSRLAYMILKKSLEGGEKK